MARVGRFGFLAIAIIFHLIYIYSIFDIYFVSPIVSGMKEYKVERSENQEAPAKRLFLFVGDGLRADKAFQSFPDPSPADPTDPSAHEPRPLAPFIRSRVLLHGTFGVSHTRVPTESRPGHVALIAGLYEDVSAVTTGWKLNPVNFDSVFNRSRHTWSWGSPDILPMFKEGAVPGRIDADTYSEEAEDFTSDATRLDTWVFDKVKELFESAKTDEALNKALHDDQLVFFLHLLGLDTTGHGYRPYSREYLHNIKVVDEGVREITNIVENFYKDAKTAYVFTADHGMSDWGSHGDGHPDNTRTPLVVWGSGVAGPNIYEGREAPGHDDKFSAGWGFNHIQRHDVAQADVATLMAYLVGLEFPVNSVGELPLSYLAADPKQKAEAALVNVREILEMYHVKESQKSATEFRFKPFAPFGDNEHSIEYRISAIRELIDSGDYESAILDCKDLLHLGLDGLRYLQTYDWLFLRALVTAGYVGWIAYALTTVIDLHVLHGTVDATRNSSTVGSFISILVMLYSTLWVRHASWTYYAYAFFPVLFWEEVFARRPAWTAGKDVLLRNLKTKTAHWSLILEAAVSVGLLEALVQSYFHREIFTLCFILGAIWPLSYGVTFVKQNSPLIGTWVIGCVFMSTFTLLPVVKVEDINIILAGGFLMFLTGLVYILFEDSIMAQSSSEKTKMTPSAITLSRGILGLQCGLVLLAMIVTRSSVASLQAKKGLPLGNQVVGWFVLGTSMITPILHGLAPNKHYLHQLVVIFLTFSPIFIILTISYEGLFYFAFCTTLVTWVRLEHRIYCYNNARPTSTQLTEEINPLMPAIEAAKSRLHGLKDGDYRALTLSDVRIALFFLFLLQSAFFSTGNIASISSFSLESVCRLIPVFNPLSQGALLILKLMIPFAVISANLGVLNRRLGVAPSALFMIVMAISDVMTLNFFYMVRDEGSWLDIGTSISHFCIASLLCVFVAGLEFVSEVFVRGVEMGDDKGTVTGIEEPSQEQQTEEQDGLSKMTNGTTKGGLSSDFTKALIADGKPATNGKLL
ncbi:MAG: Glycosyl phosphatidyl inositol anchor synthesis [Cirrosporium novae-zelandiae]|nr:MAG: Glycosyl phosphatidyl inositol anchor synthesis [Cirrosporium novae-zelandiae]